VCPLELSVIEVLRISEICAKQLVTHPGYRLIATPDHRATPLAKEDEWLFRTYMHVTIGSNGRQDPETLSLPRDDLHTWILLC
jgi:hypothetical protein